MTSGANDDARCRQVHRFQGGDPLASELTELPPAVGSALASRTRALGLRDGQRFPLGPDGRPDLRVNSCLASAKWRNLRERSQRDYTYSVGEEVSPRPIR